MVFFLKLPLSDPRLMVAYVFPSSIARNQSIDAFSPRLESVEDLASLISHVCLEESDRRRFIKLVRLHVVFHGNCHASSFPMVAFHRQRHLAPISKMSDYFNQLNERQKQNSWLQKCIYIMVDEIYFGFEQGFVFLFFAFFLWFFSCYLFISQICVSIASWWLKETEYDLVTPHHDITSQAKCWTHVQLAFEPSLSFWDSEIVNLLYLSDDIVARVLLSNTWDSSVTTTLRGPSPERWGCLGDHCLLQRPSLWKNF